MRSSRKPRRLSPVPRVNPADRYNRPHGFIFSSGGGDMTRSRLAPLLILLAAAAAFLAFPAAAQEGFSPFTTDYPPDEFAARRNAAYDAIGKDGVALVQGAETPVGYIRFRQSNDFYYLCGVEVPNAYLLLDGGRRRATLFLPHRNAGRERGEGKMLSSEDAEEIEKLSGVEGVLGTDLLGETLGRMVQAGSRPFYTPLAPAEGFAV